MSTRYVENAAATMICLRSSIFNITSLCAPSRNCVLVAAAQRSLQAHNEGEAG